jgi:hypothetical protein
MSAVLGISLASLAIPVVVGLYLYDANRILNEKQRELKKLESELKEGKPTQGVENGNDKDADKKLDATRKELEEKAKELETLKKELEQREDALSLREKAVSQRESKLEEATVPDVVPAEEPEEESEADATAAEEKPKVSEGEKPKNMIEEELAEIVKDAEDKVEPEGLEVLQKAAHKIWENAGSERETKLEAVAVSKTDVVPAKEEPEADAPAAEEKPKVSEGEKRTKMIEEELARIVKDAEDNELEDELDPEALEVLQKAAHKICYLKKYYDVIKDEVIFFPSVTKTFMNYTLIEEAEKYWYDEEDEFPMFYSAALRSTATESMSGDDADQDDDYMFKLAMDVEI